MSRPAIFLLMNLLVAACGESKTDDVTLLQELLELSPESLGGLSRGSGFWLHSLPDLLELLEHPILNVTTGQINH